MISVEQALDKVFALARTVGTDRVALADAAGRILAEDVIARRDQPPFRASAMDGYAMAGDGVLPGAAFDVIGTAAAGAAFAGRVGPGQAVRIFTGAPVPDGADKVVIQEDVDRDGDRITLRDRLDAADHLRPAGGDFKAGSRVSAPLFLRPQDLTLLAAMNVPVLTVRARPVVALIATGDELVMPGEDPRPDQIVASNSFGLKAMLQAAGAEVRLLPIARDNAASLRTAFALAEGADLVVTIGGASVGDHDLVAKVATDLGLERAFYKIAMRPGKPLMAGRMGDAAMIGLPGNPVSSMVCGQVFVVPLIRAMLGLGHAPAPRERMPLSRDMEANGPREHYMRAQIASDGVAPLPRQDSSLMSVLAAADALLVRPVEDPPRKAGTMVEIIRL